MARKPTLPPRDQIADDTPLRLGIGGRGRLPGRINDGEWIAEGSGEGPACDRTHRGQGLHDTPLHRANEGAMPRRSKGPRLWLRRAQYDRNGRFTHAAV